MAAFVFSEWWTAVHPLALFIGGMVVYAIFIFSFYKHLAKKELFKLHLDKYNTSENPRVKKAFRVVAYIIQHILLFPIIVLFWFSILAVLLAFMSKNDTPEVILLVSVALIGSVRIVAYISETLSEELSKMLPFALLGIYLVDITYVSFNDSLLKISDIFSQGQHIAYYLIFLIAIELALRGTYETSRYLFSADRKIRNKNEGKIIDDS